MSHWLISSAMSNDMRLAKVTWNHKQYNSAKPCQIMIQEKKQKVDDLGSGITVQVKAFTQIHMEC